ncbi:hypothetical protein pb186bvf_019195 [Paramecium bursaria]
MKQSDNSNPKCLTFKYYQQSFDLVQLRCLETRVINNSKMKHIHLGLVLDPTIDVCLITKLIFYN